MFGLSISVTNAVNNAILHTQSQLTSFMKTDHVTCEFVCKFLISTVHTLHM